jgi:hypothetical protein
MVLGVPWLDYEHASLQFGTTRVFTLMDRTAVETQIEEQRVECLLTSSGKIQKLVSKTRRSMVRNAEFYVINISSIVEQPAEFHIGKEFKSKQRGNLRSLLLYDDFPE